VESDHQFFERRRRETSRVRPPFPDELRDLQLQVPPRHKPLIIVTVRHDRRTGTVTRARGVLIVPVQ
jgi:hypothetical protein